MAPHRSTLAVLDETLATVLSQQAQTSLIRLSVLSLTEVAFEGAEEVALTGISVGEADLLSTTGISANSSVPGVDPADPRSAGNESLFEMTGISTDGMIGDTTVTRSHGHESGIVTKGRRARRIRGM